MAPPELLVANRSLYHGAAAIIDVGLAEAPRGYQLMAERQDGALKVLLKP
jgi:threonine dehydrogenase-like Zn-dependent dehydrogenase